MPELDLAKLRAAAAELGYWPATTDDEHLAKLRDENDRFNGVYWIGRHKLQGHDPQPAPTPENPEQWHCDCGGVWRVLTLEQTRRKFAHLSSRRPYA